jgi:transposase-like protein
LTTREEAEKAAQRILKTKYCSTCNSHRPIEHGSFTLASNGNKKWICDKCLKKISDQKKS